MSADLTLSLLTLLLLGLALFALFIGYFIYARIIKKTKEEAPVRYPVEWVDFKDQPAFNTKDRSFEAQTSEWKEAMYESGEYLASHNVKHVVFAHGTFVGDDPLGLTELLKIILPNLKQAHSISVRKLIKNHNDRLMKDTANFLTEYACLYEKAIGHNISCYRFKWQSGNYHIARLKGTLKLVDHLYETSKNWDTSQKPRILLQGHSHAGQMFALLSHFLYKTKESKKLVEVLQDLEIEIFDFNKKIKHLKNIELDFVTLGTPILYEWPHNNKYRLLHLINHRGDDVSTHKFKGILNTQYGDYVQQIGVAGSDFIAPTPQERALNKKLNKILIENHTHLSWLDIINQGVRIPAFGDTYLVNYHDESKIVPNCIGTMFGHGIYTTFKVMLFNTRLITKYFYSYNEDL